MTTLKKIKMLMTVIPLLLSLSLFSVGFAGWVSVIPTTPAGAGGNIHSYGVSESSKLIDIVDDVSVFKYRAESFVDESGNLVDSGIIAVKYRINLDECSKEFGDNWDGSLELHLTLRAHNVREVAGSTALFDTTKNGKTALEGYTYSYSITAKVDGADAEIKNTGGTTLEIDYTIQSSEKTGDKDVTVVYTFNIPKNLETGSNIPANFRHCLGQYLKENKENDEGTKFVSSAWVEK